MAERRKLGPPYRGGGVISAHKPLYDRKKQCQVLGFFFFRFLCAIALKNSGGMSARPVPEPQPQFFFSVVLVLTVSIAASEVTLPKLFVTTTV